MSDAWRVTVVFDDPAPAKRAARELSVRELLVGARNQDEAQALAAAIQAQAPPWAVTSVLRAPYTAADVVRATRLQNSAQMPPF